ncbi:MAG: histidine phosphatase family protein [bacterium]|nr:histidine phosphatase family protein [bacterium]
MANPLRIVMIRHGQSESNIVQQHQKFGGQFEFEEEINTRVDWKQRLSQKGVAQAENGAANLRKMYGGMEFFDKFYVSPFIRARETAVKLSQNQQLRWRIDDRLSERIWGIYGVVSRQEQRSHFPLTARLANDDPWYIRYDGGESLFDVYNRFKSFRTKLWRKHSNENILIVAHKQLIQTACYDIEKKLPEDWDKIYENRKYDVPNLGLVEYSRVNPWDARDVRENFAWRRIVNLGEAELQNAENWEEFVSDKSFFTEELAEQISNYPPFL